MAKTLRAALKIDFGTDVRLGPGKVRLLELIAETGSISAAARRMEMSYRRAWLLIEEFNGIFGQAVVETASGGAGGGGARVTPYGQKIIAAFRDVERQADGLVKAKFGAIAKIKSR